MPIPRRNPERRNRVCAVPASLVKRRQSEPASSDGTRLCLPLFGPLLPLAASPLYSKSDEFSFRLRVNSATFSINCREHRGTRRGAAGSGPPWPHNDDRSGWGHNDHALEEPLEARVTGVGTSVTRRPARTVRASARWRSTRLARFEHESGAGACRRSTWRRR
jgi:hypothetical protein